jgi:Ca-activated chloride channel family protein
MPTFDYARWDDAHPPRRLSAAAAFDRLADFLLDHGGYILRQLEYDADLLRLLLREGYLEPNPAGGHAVSPKGLRRIEDKALQELFQVSARDGAGKHATRHPGAGEVRHEDSKRYDYGDPVANLNLHETLRQALRRRSPGERATPVPVRAEDVIVYETEYQTSCATVLLLDMSGSMARYGNFAQARRVALALRALVRSRYPEDTLHVAGFWTLAAPLTERELLRAGPKPVSLFDHRVRLRLPLDRLPPGVPEHFTNLQAGLRCARQLLRRHPARNKQVICVTDGEPTAHLEGNDLVLSYPPSERTATATLEEAGRCRAEGLRLSTFALVEDRWYLGLQNFVDRMARCSRGVAVYGTAGQLGRYVHDSFVGGHRARKPVR